MCKARFCRPLHNFVYFLTISAIFTPANQSPFWDKARLLYLLISTELFIGIPHDSPEHASIDSGFVQFFHETVKYPIMILSITIIKLYLPFINLRLRMRNDAALIGFVAFGSRSDLDTNSLDNMQQRSLKKHIALKTLPVMHCHTISSRNLIGSTARLRISISNNFFAMIFWPINISDCRSLAISKLHQFSGYSIGSLSTRRRYKLPPSKSHRLNRAVSLHSLHHSMLSTLDCLMLITILSLSRSRKFKWS